MLKVLWCYRKLVNSYSIKGARAPIICLQITIWVCVCRLVKTILKKIYPTNLYKNFLWYSWPFYSHLIFSGLISCVQSQLSLPKHKPVLRISLTHCFPDFRKGLNSPFRCPNHWFFISSKECVPPSFTCLQILLIPQNPALSL